MKILFSLIFLFNIISFATTFDIHSLNSDNRAKNVLEKYLKKSQIEVKNSDHLNFYIGTKEDIKKSHKKIFENLNNFKNDGYIIQLKEDSIFIIGTNKRSSIYGIYSFLERNLKYKFLSKNFEVIPSNVKLKKNNIDFQSESRFKYREIFIKELEDNNFAMKLSLNGSLGHKAKKNSDFFINTYNYFTPFQLIKEKYRELYPEFFCSGQLDFALSDVKKYANINFQKKIKSLRDSDEDSYYIAHEDIQSFCNSSNSRKLIKKYGSKSAAFLEYVNYIATQNPTKNIFFEAYQWSRKAPNNFPELSANLNIFFSDIEANFAKPLVEDENNKIYQDLLSWEKYDKDMYIWHYITNFNGYFQPYPNVTSTAKDIKNYSKLNMVKGIFLQGSYETNFSNLSNLRAWVFSKLLWNPELDEKRLIQEFSYYYYGKAYKTVLKYFTLLENEVKKTNSKLLVKTSINSRYLNKDFIKKAKNILDKALLQVPKNSVYYNHLIELYSSIDYVQLLRGTISLKDKKRFKKFLKDNKIQYHAEGNPISSLNPYFNIKREKPKIPLLVKYIKKEWLDFQEYELKLCCSNIVEDKKASSSSAVRMNGDKSDWGIQLDLNTLPKGKWKIYANVRIEKSDNIKIIDFIKPAIYYGIYDKRIKNLSLINTLKDENYHEVFIGKFNITENESGQVWIRPPNDTSVKYIFVDRIFIIKE